MCRTLVVEMIRFSASRSLIYIPELRGGTGEKKGKRSAHAHLLPRVPACTVCLVCDIAAWLLYFAKTAHLPRRCSRYSTLSRCSPPSLLLSLSISLSHRYILTRECTLPPASFVVFSVLPFPPHIPHTFRPPPPSCDARPVRKHLLECIEDIEGRSKALVIEKGLVGLLGLIAEFSALKERGIDKVFPLSQGPLPSVCPATVMYVDWNPADVVAS